MEDVKDVLDAGLESLRERVQFRGRPDVLLKLRKKIDLAGLRFTFGTDFPLVDREGDGCGYTPNFQWDLRDKFFNGKVRVESKAKQITYNKSIQVEKFKVQLNAGINYISGQTYLGFNVKSSMGMVSSSQSNGISFHQKFDTMFEHPKVKVAVAGVVDLPLASYNANNNAMEIGPVYIEPEYVNTTVTF